jgi:hypothetical protein
MPPVKCLHWVFMDLNRLLDASRASAEFKDAVRRFTARGDWDRIRVSRFAPPVKVARVLTQLLAARPELEVEYVHIDAHSGCSNFLGVLYAHTPSGVRRFAFEWCCRWRAETLGWKDYFGLPDQIRAANEFGWRCFKTWRELEEPAPTLAA